MRSSRIRPAPRLAGRAIPAAALGPLAACLALLLSPGVPDAQEAPRAASTAAPSAPASSCLSCHSQLEEEMLAPATAWAHDVHAAAGLGCESCHGGDPSPSLAKDDEAAMTKEKGFHAPPGRLEVAGFCARCHSDAAYMKRFNPQIRVDQLAEYRTSVHGKRNAEGDSIPATCTDCHGAHGIRQVTSPESPVFATNVPATCARCHGDAILMAPYEIPTDQYEAYSASAHAAALLDRGDVAAPACNDCHGNHGAAPPGVESVARVCGHCHGREAVLFGGSFKKPLFEEQEIPECSVCHDHHRILHPTPELFHGQSAPELSQGRVAEAAPFRAVLGAIAAGEKATATWRMLLRAHIAPDDARLVHRIEISAEGVAPFAVDATVRPGDPLAAEARTRTAASGPLAATLTIEPLSGAPVEAGDALRLALVVEASAAVEGVQVRDSLGRALDPIAGSACLACHSPGDSCDVATERMYAALSSLDRDLRQAAAILHTAEVAGMEVSEPLFELKSKGITAAVEARAFIHAFDPDRLVRRTEDGKKVAAAAYDAGKAALAEVQNRRKGLAVSLILVACVLGLLSAKIRAVDRARRERGGGEPRG